jgi:hypothetical protein
MNHVGCSAIPSFFLCLVFRFGKVIQRARRENVQLISLILLNRIGITSSITTTYMVLDKRREGDGLYFLIGDHRPFAT